MADYSIKLGVDVDVSDIQSQINSKAKDTLIPVKLEIENIGDIKKQIQSLGGIKGSIEIPLTIDTNAAIKSAQQVGQKVGSTVTKSVQKSLNIDGLLEKETVALMKEYGISAKSKSGVAAKNEIKKALTGYVNEVRSGGKTIDDEFFGSINTIDTALRKVTDAIAKNKKEVIELDSLYEDLIRDIKSINNGKGAVKISLPDMRSEWGDDYAKNKDLLGSWFSEKYAGTAGSIGIDSWVKSKNWSSLLDLSGSHQDIANQLVDLVKKTKTVYSGDELFREGFLRIGDVEARIKESASNIIAAEQKMIQSSNSATDAIVQNQQRQQEAYENSSKTNLDRIKSELEQAKQREKEIDRLIEDNNKRFQDATVSGDTAGILDSSNRMDELDAESKTVKAYIETLEASYKQAANARKSITQQISGFDDAKQTLKSLDFNTNSLDKMISDFEELGVTVKKVTHSLNKDGSITFNVEGIDEAKNVVKAVKTLKSDGSFGSFSSSVSQDLKASEKFLKQQKQTVANLTNQINQMNRSAIDQNASRPIKDTSHLDTLSSKYDEIAAAIQRMNNASDSNTFADEKIEVEKLISEYKSLVKEFKNAENVSSKMKGTDFTSGLDIARNDLEKFKAQAKDFPQITQTIENLDRAIEGVGDASSLNKFNDQLRVARSELAKIKSETSAANRSEKVGINVSGLESKIADLQRISPEIDRFEAEIDGAKVSVQSLLSDLKQVNTQGDFSVVNSRFKAFADAAKAAGIAISETASKTKAAFADDIEIKLNAGKFSTQVEKIHNDANKLSNTTKELRIELDMLDAAESAMNSAFKSGTVEEKIAAYQDYLVALERVKNQLEQNKIAEQNANNAVALENKTRGLSLDMDNWLKDNSAAAKQFGDAIRELKTRLESCNDVEFGNIKSEFQNIKKEAKALGLTTKTVGDKLKEQFAQYSTYFGIAEVFMWAEQGLRSMYDAVVEIDTAMTGLYRVTDLTSAQYDSLFDSMTNSAKEYGATLTDIINATSDWVRAGFDADTALGLAEVTTMYQHISDLDYDTAAENLITAYNGFKDELNTAFSGDEVAAVEYIADIFNELDNNFAVTSAGLGEALTRSASALDLAGNSIQETAG